MVASVRKMTVLPKEAMPKTQAEILDDNHAIWASGTELLPLCPAPPAGWAKPKQQKMPHKGGAFVFEVCVAI